MTTITSRPSSPFRRTNESTPAGETGPTPAAANTTDNTFQYTPQAGSKSAEDTPSSRGFAAMLRPLLSLSTRAKLAIVAGFLVLIPPSAGVVVRWDDPAPAPAFTQSYEKAKALGEPQALVAKLHQANGSQQSPLNTEASCREMVRLFEVEGNATVRSLDLLIGATRGYVGQLGQNQPTDAKLGKPVDWYWFGIAPASQPFHEGNQALSDFESQKSRWDVSEPAIRGLIRHSIALMMGKVDPSFKSNYETLLRLRSLSVQLRELGENTNQASVKINEADEAWSRFDRTDRTIWVDVNGERVKKDNPDYSDNQRKAESATEEAQDAIQTLESSLRGFRQVGLTPQLELTSTRVERGTIYRVRSALNDLSMRLALHTQQTAQRVGTLESKIEPQISEKWNSLAPADTSKAATASASPSTATDSW